MELSSFPCVSVSITTRVYERFLVEWARLQRLGGPRAKPFFTMCEEYELIGATSVGAAVMLYVLLGYGLLLPSLQADSIFGVMLKGLCSILFTAQVIVGYACLWLFRNTDPGYIPVNEGALGQTSIAQR
jgi:hypothetical protein